MNPHRVPTRPRSETLRPIRLLVVALTVLGMFAVGCADDDEATVSDPAVETTTPGATPDDGATTPTVDDATPEPTATPSADEETPTPEETSTPDAATPEPTTSDAEEGIEIDVACVDGEPAGTAPLPISDIEEIDDVVNTIDFCEGAGGLASVSFTAPCPSGDRDVVVAAVGGALPDIASLDLCENEG